MIRPLVIGALAAAFFASSAHAAGDPRGCGATGGHISAGPVVDGPTFCAYQAASLAFRRYMTTIGHLSVIYSAPMKCAEAGSNLVWTCTFAQGTATVRFRALSNGWHTRVTVVCDDPAAKGANLCRMG